VSSGHLGRREAKLRYIDTVMEYATTKNYDGCVWAFERGFATIVDRNGNTLLHHAANTGRSDSTCVLRLLLMLLVGLPLASCARSRALPLPPRFPAAFFADSDATVTLSLTPCVCLRLFAAAAACSRRIVKLCLRWGISPASQNHAGRTCIHTMVEQRTYPKQLELIEYMAYHGCDMETRDGDGRTALALACSVGRTDIMDLLLRMEAEVRVACHVSRFGSCLRLLPR
jgi:ankyrin repeat protein